MKGIYRIAVVVKYNPYGSPYLKEWAVVGGYFHPDGRMFRVSNDNTAGLLRTHERLKVALYGSKLDLEVEL